MDKIWLRMNKIFYSLVRFQENRKYLYPQTGIRERESLKTPQILEIENAYIFQTVLYPKFKFIVNSKFEN